MQEHRNKNVFETLKNCGIKDNWFHFQIQNSSMNIKHLKYSEYRLQTNFTLKVNYQATAETFCYITTFFLPIRFLKCRLHPIF